MIILDGSYLEGGGQILRTALALSALTKQSFEINNIRAKRPQPGLKKQHLECINTVKEFTRAKTNDIQIGEQNLRFLPNDFKPQSLEVDIETAGSITLLLQSILLPTLFQDKKSKLTIKGGTDVEWSPSIDYFQHVLLPHYNKYADINFTLKKRGYFPKGQGEIEINIKPKQNPILPKIDQLEQRNLLQIRGISHASTDLEERHVAERQASSARAQLSKIDCPINIQSIYTNTASTGSGITLYAIFSEGNETNIMNPIRIGSDIVGKKEIRAEDIGKLAADNLIEQVNSKAPIDKFLADQLIPLIALTNSQIRVSEITEHTKTNIWVTEQFLDKKFEIKDNIIRLKR